MWPVFFVGSEQRLAISGEGWGGGNRAWGIENRERASVMVVNVLVARSGASAELWGAVGSRRLSPTAKTLPKTARRLPTPATVCHELPRTASFSRRVRRSAFRGTCDLVTGHVAMLMAGLVLGRISVSKRAGIRSVASDPLPENEGKGTRSPVTVCHINFGGAWEKE